MRHPTRVGFICSCPRPEGPTIKTPSFITLNGKKTWIVTSRGVKEGRPLSPLLFILYYDVLVREFMQQCPESEIFVYAIDIAKKKTGQR